MTPLTAAHQSSLSFTVSRICSNSCPLSRYTLFFTFFSIMVYQRNTQYSCLYCILDPCCLLHSKHHSLHLPTPNFRSIALPLAITSLFSCGLTMICESWTPCTLVLLAKCQDSKWLKQNPWLSFKYIDTVLKIVFPSFWLANSKPLLKYTCFFLQKYFLSLLYIVYAQNWNEEYETHTHTCTLMCMCTCMCAHTHTLTLSVSLTLHQ